jgi:hypothetical protein
MTIQPRLPTIPPSGVHSYYAAAYLLTADFEQPVRETIRPRAYVKLPEDGHYQFKLAGPFRLDGVVSYQSGYTQVAGYRNANPAGGFITLATAVVEGLNVLDVVTADRVVAQISTEHPVYDPDDGETDGVPSVSFLGTRFDNLRIDGQKVELERRVDILGPKPAGGRSYFEDDGVLSLVSQQYANINRTKDLPEWAIEKYRWDQASVIQRGKLECSLVNRVAGAPGISFGHVIDLPKFGKIFLAELTFQREKNGSPDRYSFRLTMARLELNDIARGSAVIASVDLNGGGRRGGGNGGGPTLGSGEGTNKSEIAMPSAIPPRAGKYDRAEGEGQWTNIPVDISLKGALAPARRVVNISFNWQGGFLKTDQPLHCNTEYDLQLWVGGNDPKSIVRDPAALPEEWLRKFMSKDGVTIRVVLSSRDFALLDQERSMILPQMGSSEVLTFRVRTPSETGTARLRAVLYYACNALQSLLVTALVTEEVVISQPSALAADVEYCLCGTLHDIEMYPPRSLNFLTNESPDGTHTFSVVGTDIRENFTFTEGEMTTSLKQTRQTLLETCAELDKNGTPVKYRYDPTTNAGTEKQFVEDVKKLAWAGWDLYCDFVTNKNQSFAQVLRDALSNRAYIQVSSVKSAKYVFPWALVYDKPLLVDPKNTVCEMFLQDLRDVGDLSDPARVVAALETSYCMSIGCPARDDSTVICPSGFWGLKHILEQPPSVAHDPGDEPRDVQTHLIVNGEAKMVMAVSLKLEYSAKHFDEMSTLKQYRITLKQNKSAMLSALKAFPSPNVIYLYCHGGKEKGKGFLSVGDDEHLWPNDLVGGELSWPSSHPLVFINGCRTAELSPDDLLGFVNTFAWCQASGVIGTEISIPESLAREFAVAIFKSLEKSGSSIGEAISAQRLLLLAKYNLLGLAYTPYCHSALQFEFRS